MKYLRTYYLVDTLSETIVGSFTAPNERFALKRVKATIEKNDDLKDIIKFLRLYSSLGDFEVAETYDESVDNKITSVVLLDSVVDSIIESMEVDNG